MAGAAAGRRQDRGDGALGGATSAGCWPSPRATPADAAARALVALAMGPLGVASRVLGGRYGAPFTFAAPDERTRGRARASCRRPCSPRATASASIGPATRVYGLLGSDVLRSLSPAIQNRAFAERGMDAVYVPLQAESMDAFVRALPALGLSGFSVTRPYKGEILPHLDSVDAARGRAPAR